MLRTTILRNGVLTGLCLLGLLGCNGSDDDLDNGNVGDDKGELSLWITDAPIPDADELIITITGVAIKPVAEEAPLQFLLDQPLVVDLIDVAETTTEMREKIIDDLQLAAGTYQWIQLLLDETRLFIGLDGSQFPLTIPEAEQNRLQIQVNLLIDDDTDLDLTIDFDVRKSLRNRGNSIPIENRFELHPSLRIVRTETTGTLTGVVAEALIQNEDCRNGFDEEDEGNAVYVFSGSGANFQDIQDNAGDPLATALVEPASSFNENEFIVGFLPQGNYTAVFTCDADFDDPELDDGLNMVFSEGIDVEIVAGEATNIVFDSSLTRH
jgi:hypothetical protein